MKYEASKTLILNSTHSTDSIYSHRRAGFTLIEIILSVALLGILAASAAPVYHALYLKNDLAALAAYLSAL